MDIKDLNKSQLILLAVLLSFITSLATGITTVTLMQQAPESVTVPVNRVIRQTVEKIQQVEGTTTVQTVVVKEEDLVVDAIAKNKDAVFKITQENNSTEVPAGRGFVVSSDGIVVADKTHVPGSGNYFVENSHGRFKAEFLKASDSQFSFLKIGAPVNGTDKAVFTAPSFADIGEMKAGQKLIFFGDHISTSIYEGGVPADMYARSGEEGSLILNLNGDVVGGAFAGNATRFIPIKLIRDALAAD